MNIRKYSLTLNRHRTSVSLEEPFYDALTEIAQDVGKTVPALIEEIDATRRDSGLSSAIRLYVLSHYRQRAAQDLSE